MVEVRWYSCPVCSKLQKPTVEIFEKDGISRVIVKCYVCHNLSEMTMRKYEE